MNAPPPKDNRSAAPARSAAPGGTATADHPLAAPLLGAPGPAQRRAMAKAITLLESTRPDHRAQADALLTGLLPRTGRSLRLGISGVPGVGKSTFIEALGLALLDQGHRVAVLAVDPSSSVSGGSILGDKTRMERLSMDPRAYIRPSPSSGTLGGVAEKTREAMLVCEAAGFDIVIVETVGVGQSETAVAGMTDMYCLLQLPNAGDDLQAIKKGVMELADLVVINKADLDDAAATRAQAQITSSLRLYGMHRRPAHDHRPPLGHAPGLAGAAGAGEAGSERGEHGARANRPFWEPRVMRMSALKGEGVDAFWRAVTEFQALQRANGAFEEKRQQQALAWMWERIQSGLKQQFKAAPAVRGALEDITARVLGGQLAASTAARELLAKFSGDRNPEDSKDQRHA